MPVRVHFHISQLTSKLAFHHELPSPSPFLLCHAGTAPAHFSRNRQGMLHGVLMEWHDFGRQKILQQDVQDNLAINKWR